MGFQAIANAGVSRKNHHISDAGALFIEPGSPWENGYVESFNGKLRDELLDREIFYTLEEAKVLIEMWREHYNQVRPHSSLGYRSPAPESIAAGPPSASCGPAGSEKDQTSLNHSHEVWYDSWGKVNTAEQCKKARC